MFSSETRHFTTNHSIGVAQYAAHFKCRAYTRCERDEMRAMREHMAEQMRLPDIELPDMKHLSNAELELSFEECGRAVLQPLFDANRQRPAHLLRGPADVPAFAHQNLLSNQQLMHMANVLTDQFGGCEQLGMVSVWIESMLITDLPSN